MLIKLPVKRTSRRAPGPGPLRLRDWTPIADHYIKQSKIILHTDAARAYKKAIPGVVHTQVIHQKKKINGTWVDPFFTKQMLIKLPTGPTVRRKAGTQTIDGLWTMLRKDTRKYQGSFDILDDLIRLCQWRIWTRGQAPTISLAKTCAKPLQAPAP